VKNKTSPSENRHQGDMPGAPKPGVEATKQSSAASFLPLSQPKRNKHRTLDTSLVLSIIALAIGVIIALLQWNGVVSVRWQLSIACYLSVSIGCLWALWNWEVAQAWPSLRRITFCISIGIILAGISASGVITEYKREQTPKSVLEVSSQTTGLSYEKGTKIGGIEWEGRYGDLRVNVDNNWQESIENVDLTVQVIPEGIIFSMGQMSNIPAVEFQHPNLLMPDFRLRTNAGSTFSVSAFLRNMFDLGLIKEPVFSNKWRVFCPLLIGKSELRLILAVPVDKSGGILPRTVKVFGTYELMPSEGSKRVKVDLTTSIKS
jgi:hypothetical protein